MCDYLLNFLDLKKFFEEQIAQNEKHIFEEKSNHKYFFQESILKLE